MSKKTIKKRSKNLPQAEFRMREYMSYFTEVPPTFLDRQKYTSPIKEEVRAQIPGTICDIFVEEGQAVEVGDNLLILDAMKMHNQVLSPIKGTIKSLKVKKGDIVRKEDLLLVLA